MRLTTATTGGMIVSSALRLAPPAVAEMVTTVVCNTVLDVMAKLSDDMPGETGAVGAWTWTTAGLLLANWMVSPPAPAAPLSVSCPMVDRPPVIVVALSTSDAGVCAFATSGEPIVNRAMATTGIDIRLI